MSTPPMAGSVTPPEPAVSQAAAHTESTRRRGASRETRLRPRPHKQRG